MFNVPIPDSRFKFLIKITQFSAYHFQLTKYNKLNNKIIDPFT